MESTIKLAEAAAWPLSAALVAFAVLLIVFRVTSKKGEFSFGIKDWLKFGTRTPASPHIAEPTSIEPPPERIAHEAESTAETVAEVTDDAAPIKSTAFWLETNATELEQTFQRFREDSAAYQSDPEFWESIYVDRRRELSVGDELRELTGLVEKNPSWIWPLVFLIRRHVRLRDSASAEAALQAALARDNPEKLRWALREGVSLYYRLYGLDKALTFCRESVNKGVSDIETALMFIQLAELVEVENDTFSSVLLREIGASFARDDKDNLFKLAYRYGESGSFLAIAYERYRQLGITDDNWVNSPNNMGVAVKKFSDSLQNDFFEKALALNSPVAAANLARSLVTDGYVRRAELILGQVTEQNATGKDASALADARAKVASARAELEIDQQRFEQFSSKQDGRYKSAIMAAFSFFKDTGAVFLDGVFSSSDSEIIVAADYEGANCTYKMGEVSFTGRLPRKPMCYEGFVTSGNGLLAPTRHVLIVQVGENDLRVIVWPNSDVAMDPIRLFELKRVIVQPQLALESESQIPAGSIEASNPSAEDGS